MGKQLVCLALRVGFDEIGLHRIDLGVFDVNLPAIKCYLSAGFVKEGISREAAKVENSYWNMVQMAILEQEWQALKKGSWVGEHLSGWTRDLRGVLPASCCG